MWGFRLPVPQWTHTQTQTRTHIHTHSLFLIFFSSITSLFSHCLFLLVSHSFDQYFHLLSYFLFIKQSIGIYPLASWDCHGVERGRREEEKGRGRGEERKRGEEERKMRRKGKIKESGKAKEVGDGMQFVLPFISQFISHTITFQYIVSFLVCVRMYVCV